MERKAMQGDPLTVAKRKGHISVNWEDRIIVDQYKTYKNNESKNTHADKEKGWEEHLEQIVLEEENTDLSVRWFEYKSKKCKKNPPLVISFFEYFNTCWQRVADREGLVVVSFEYHRNSRLPEGGRGALGFGPRMDEIVSYHHVIERIVQKYNVDRKRIYISGLSYGDLTTLMYVKKYGNELAAAVNMNGPSCGYNIQRLGLEKLPAIPSMQFRSDDDVSCDGFPAGLVFPLEGNEEWIRNARSRVVLQNRDIFIKGNDVKDLKPIISSTKDRMFATYPSRKGDVIFVEYFKHSHILPIDTAEVMWDNLFTRYYRENGVIKETKEKGLAPDKNAVALVAGYKNAYINNKVVKLSTNCLVLDQNLPLSGFVSNYIKSECKYSSFYAPADILKLGFGLNYHVVYTKDYSVPWITGKKNKHLKLKDGYISFKKGKTEYKLYLNTCVAEVNGIIKDLERPVLTVDNVLMVPVAQVAELLGMYSAENNDVIYIADHKVSLGYTFSRMFREEILATKPLTKKFNLTVYPSKNGNIEIEKFSSKEGNTLHVHVKPNKGYKLQELKAYMNGLVVPVNHIQDDLWFVCNCFGNVEIEAVFEK